MTVILASGTDGAASSDFTVAAGSSATVFLTGGAGAPVDNIATARIQIKSAGGGYFDVPGGLLNCLAPALCVAAPGTYRVLRTDARAAFAVEKE